MEATYLYLRYSCIYMHIVVHYCKLRYENNENEKN